MREDSLTNELHAICTNIKLNKSFGWLTTSMSFYIFLLHKLLKI